MRIRGVVQRKSRHVKVSFNLAGHIFNNCKAVCFESALKMSQGAFAAKKVRKNMENRYYDSRDLKQDASNYNSKYMNSIWGMYNRFSVHNLKKIMDDNTYQSQQASVGQAVKGLAASSGLSVSMERLSYLPQ